MRLKLDVKGGYKFLIVLILSFIVLILFVKPKVVKKDTSEIDEIVSVSIRNGNIVGVTTSGDEFIVVNKREYENIKEFSDVSVSPSRKKMCFVGKMKAAQRLYVANLDGVDVINFAYGQNCVWSSDNQKVAYNNFVTDVSPIDVYVYFLGSEVKKNYTRNKYDGDLRFYERPRWITGGKFLESKFLSSEVEGLSVINIKTGELVDK